MDEDFIRDLKQKYPAYTRLNIQLVDWEDAPPFGEDDFWDIMAHIDLNKANPVDAIKPAQERLSAHPVVHIFQFEDMMAARLRSLDTAEHAAAAYPAPKRLSADGFLYVRAAAVAKGRQYYQEVLRHPEKMDGGHSFEPLLSLSANAYTLKTGEAFDYLSPVDYETGSNDAGWA